ncbi:GT2 family glycosyltransferase [Fonticella tunisiensis]|uniref:GT2 family glycosyltransferase n=1 Tax=Fonticella tunisiensis TaxID=1096341 RepID=A0A4R7KBI7_9CLOT|nr:glycosyltransferase family 2 protein [Fonticella tunisiensis]TDT52017.1 GT2 family glycosyltransferase [Fonticella tunisiensis]
MNELVSVVIINYNNKDYLGRCINSILNQTYKNTELIFIDNVSKDGSFDYVDKTFTSENIVKIRNMENLGYAGGANQGIRLSKGKYVLVMNPDVILEPNFIEECYNFINQDESIAAVSGKLLKYDFNRDVKLNIIDSTGITINRSRRAVDRGQNTEDIGQYEDTEQIFGVCGAAAFYRKSALEDIKIDQEYYDEDFFAYKEDVDLSWRLNLYGYKCMYYPNAIAYHGRGLGGSKGGIRNFIKNRKSQSEFLRGISFRNHYLMLIKNETVDTYKRDKYKIMKRTLLFLGYAVFYERFIFKYIKDILKYKNRMFEKRKVIMKNRKISSEELKRLFTC